MINNNCPYLIYKTSKSCTSCTGYRCTSQGREKKVDEKQLETCRDINEYILCTRYIETLQQEPLETLEPVEEPVVEVKYFDLPDIKEVEKPIEETESTQTPTPVKVVPCAGCGQHSVRESSCPYQGPTPEGRTSCLGIWCYANNKNIRVDKNCVNWQICSVFAMNKYKGVKFYRDR